MTETMIPQKSIRLKITPQKSAVDHVADEQAAAQAEFDAAAKALEEHQRPAKRFAEAQERLRAATLRSIRSADAAQAAAIKAAAPCLAKEIRRLELEIVNGGQLFRTYGPGQSNGSELEEYLAGCRDALAKLRSFQLRPYDEDESLEFIQQLRRDAAPRPTPEYV